METYREIYENLGYLGYHNFHGNLGESVREIYVNTLEHLGFMTVEI